MTADFPKPFAEALTPLFEALPLDQAMAQLVVRKPGPTDVVDRVIASPVVAAQPRLQAGLWLYVDQLDRSHEISQDMHDATGSFWHGIMHRREGDFGNSHYWFNRTGSHPAMKEIDGYDGHAFIDDVSAAYRKGGDQAALVEMQRREWVTLMRWCMERAE